MKKDFAGTMKYNGKDIHFLTLNRAGFTYEFWPSPFNSEDIRYSVTKEGEKALEILGLGQAEPIKSGNLL